MELFCKLLELYKTKVASKPRAEKLVIILDKLDTVIKTHQDMDILLHFLKSVYKTNNATSNATTTTTTTTTPTSSTKSTVKLILTFSAASVTSTTAPLANKTHLNILKSIEAIFTSKNSMRLSISSTSEQQADIDDGSTSLVVDDLRKTVNENIKKLLFSVDSSSSGKSYEQMLNVSFIVDLLMLMLNQTRYGLKESELREILRMYYGSSLGKYTPHLSYFIAMAWYTLKYYVQLFGVARNVTLLASSIENQQVLFRFVLLFFEHLFIANY